MAARAHGDELVEERLRWTRVQRRADTSLDSILDALRGPGDLIKASRKSMTRRVGNWAVKSSRVEGGLGVLKHTLLRSRYRQAWRAALHLSRHGVGVPEPIAFVEYGCVGIITGNVFVSEFLDDYADMEAHADRMEQEGASDEDVHAYLAGLADAVNRLTASGAHHTDLAGKNVLTRDGKTFCFVDLDGIELNSGYDRQARLENHVQLYDSLCDWWGDRFLQPFIERMLPAQIALHAWMDAVRETQARRRAAIEARWRQQGVASKHAFRRKRRE